MARYYCAICNLWDDQPGRDIYHCPFCNLCREGKGLDIDACHCMDCNTCMHLTEYPTHKCRDLAACPVCTDALFDSSHPYRVSVSAQIWNMCPALHPWPVGSSCCLDSPACMHLTMCLTCHSRT